MRILITGASGFLGRIICNALSKDNTLFSLSRSFGDYMISLDDEIPKFDQNFDLIIHSAGKAHLGSDNKFEYMAFFDVNVKGTRNLLTGIELTGLYPKQFVYISSVAVYGLWHGHQIDEKAPLLAEDPYGLSKIQAEQIILDWCKRNNVICTILRLPLVVGENPPGNLGAMMNAILKGFYFNIGGGKSKKSMVMAKDVSEFISKISSTGGIYNLTDGYHPSFFELSNHISKQLGKKAPKNLPYWLAKLIAFVGDLLGKNAPINSVKFNKITSNLTFDDSKARVAFDWYPTPVLEGFKIFDTN